MKKMVFVVIAVLVRIRLTANTMKMIRVNVKTQSVMSRVFVMTMRFFMVIIRAWVCQNVI